MRTLCLLLAALVFGLATLSGCAEKPPPLKEIATRKGRLPPVK